MAMHNAEDVRLRIHGIHGISEVIPATMVTAEHIDMIMSATMYYDGERVRHTARVKGVTHAAGVSPGVVTAVQFTDGYTVTIITYES